MYCHYADKRDRISGHLMHITKLMSLDWLTLSKLVDNNLVIRGIQGSTTGADNVLRFNKDCLDDGADIQCYALIPFFNIEVSPFP